MSGNIKKGDVGPGPTAFLRSVLSRNLSLTCDCWNQVTITTIIKVINLSFIFTGGLQKSKCWHTGSQTGTSKLRGRAHLHLALLEGCGAATWFQRLVVEEAAQGFSGCKIQAHSLPAVALGSGNQGCLSPRKNQGGFSPSFSLRGSPPEKPSAPNPGWPLREALKLNSRVGQEGCPSWAAPGRDLPQSQVARSPPRPSRAWRRDQVYAGGALADWRPHEPPPSSLGRDSPIGCWRWGSVWKPLSALRTRGELPWEEEALKEGG
ncbi:hypothetical protein H8959_009714 [Pygathrix nigripes]